MTAAQQDTRTAVPAGRVAVLRGNCMGAGVLLIIEFALGTGINLYVTLPSHKALLPTVFGSAAVAVHAILALLLLGASIAALVRAIRARRVIVLTAVGLVGVLAAGISGASFVRDLSNGASLGMALATAVAMFCYLAAVFSLRPGASEVSATTDRSQETAAR